MGKISSISNAPPDNLSAIRTSQSAAKAATGNASSVNFDRQTHARLGAQRTSFSFKVARFFRSIAEALHLRRPASPRANAQQESAAAQFNSLASRGGGLPSKTTASIPKAQINRQIDAEIVRQSAFEKETMQAFEKTRTRPRCDHFHNTVLQQTGEDISKILQQKGVKKNDSMPESRSFTAMPPWMEYQNNLRALARMRSGVAGADAQRDLGSMSKVAAELTPGKLDLTDNRLQSASRNYRDASNALSGFLRACIGDDRDEKSLKLAAHHLQAYQTAVEPNLGDKSAAERDMTHDLLLDSALGSLSLKERNQLAETLRAGGDQYRDILAAAADSGNALSEKIAGSMNRHAKTGPFIGDQALLGGVSPERGQRQEAQQALETAQAAQAQRTLSAQRQPTAEQVAIKHYGETILNASYEGLSAAEKPLLDASHQLSRLLDASVQDADGSRSEEALRGFSELLDKAYAENKKPAATIKRNRLAPDTGQVNQKDLRFLRETLQGKNKQGVQLVADALFNRAWELLPSEKKGAFLESLRHADSGIEAATEKPYSDHERRMLNCLITSMKSHPDVSAYTSHHLSAYAL